MNAQFALLPREVVEISGADRRTFLQGLISQDTEKVTPDNAAYGALLTPQGKYLHDFILGATDDTLLLDCEAGRSEDLIARLSRFKLRADVAIQADPALSVFAVFGDDAFELLALTGRPGEAVRDGDLIAMVDPRTAALGARVIGPADVIAARLAEHDAVETSFDTYDQLRIARQVPDGSRDLEVEKSILLESNIDDLNGIDWDKGCYMGQELTARTKYRGLVKRRLVAFTTDGETVAPGIAVKQGDKIVGEVRSSSGDRLLASVRLDALETTDPPIKAGAVSLRPVQSES